MLKNKVQIINKLGMHARPAAQLVKITSKFNTNVFLDKDGFEIDAKSIMGVMMLAAEQGSFLTIKCDGPDEKECMDEIINLIENKFFED